ncbi:hypothetical protein VTL71DRAFT_9174 [Oculimacula yallundae]|uniref:Fe2OG dioxygenase domain-containing protein n=1 Tax=Oculimacula yallundae TaxID=86028 RepID=A0ABR4BV12_9HELO
MADKHSFNPEGYPPFPSDLPSVLIHKISLAKLFDRNPEEIESLFVACKSHGFFYLSTRDHPCGATLERGALEIGKLAEETFDLPLEVKKKYHQGYNGSIYGYKSAGSQKTDRRGTLDTVEHHSISKDFIVNGAEGIGQNPANICEKRDLLKPFVSTAHEIGVIILSLLGSKLGLAESEMQDRHRIERCSGGQLRLTRSPPCDPNKGPEEQISTTAHTDLGSITILFNWLGGLQMWEPDHIDGSKFWSESRLSDKGRWTYVKPLPGFAIVNLGDAMTKFSNGVLNSGKHRVLPAPGEQGDFTRYSVAFFVRPEDDTVLKVLDGSGIPKVVGEKEVEKTMGQHVLDFGKAKYSSEMVKMFEARSRAAQVQT